MINEYIIEPSILFSWASNSRDYSEFLREYGLGTPRIFSCFPKQKAHKLRRFLLGCVQFDEQTQQGRRYLAMIEKITEEVISRDLQEQKNEQWIDKVIAEHSNKEFDIILTPNPINIARNITVANMYDDNSIWNHPKQISIHRTSEEIYKSVSNLIRLSTKLVSFIDAYAWNPNALKCICFILERLEHNRLCDTLPLIKIFYLQNSKGPSSNYVKSEIVNNIKSEKIKTLIEVYELEEIVENDVFHNRCILTEHGGIGTGHGLSVTGFDYHTDEATLLTFKVYEKKWNQFIGNSCFKVISRA
ncbi:TPA: hypothetical protein ACSTLY_003670 [Serratia fonticola]